ncbi:preprotein translocase subunit YajC [mine drainage metagenome]|uniref:Preprotein translocase subunit YajC n=1 Tax=mine drainage metagenome TaxID=410659 RepID=A0A1J5QTW7_9ZZZZ
MGSNTSLFVILVLGVGAMFLLSRNQRKQQKAQQSFRANLAVGQQVMTGSGMFGEVVDVDGDEITIESTPGNRSRWLRAAIAKVIEPPTEDEADDDLDDEDDEDIEVPDDLSSLDDGPAAPESDTEDPGHK